MAIKIRRGAYSSFDPAELLEGEPALVTSGDPSTTDGIALYIAQADGVAKQIAFADQVEDAEDSAAASAVDAQQAAVDAQNYAAQAMSGTPAGYSTVVSNVNDLVGIFGNMLGDSTSISVDEQYENSIPAPLITISFADAIFEIQPSETDNCIYYRRYDSGGSLIAEFQIAMG